MIFDLFFLKPVEDSVQESDQFFGTWAAGHDNAPTLDRSQCVVEVTLRSRIPPAGCRNNTANQIFLENSDVSRLRLICSSYLSRSASHTCIVLPASSCRMP